MIQIIQSNEKEKEEITAKIQTLKTFKKQYRITNTLFYRIMRHIEHNGMQKSYKETEAFMNEIPIKMRHLVVHKTHGPVIEKIHFFRKRNQDFISSIIYELKHMNMADKEILYQ